jgi:hypothetical protein
VISPNTPDLSFNGAAAGPRSPTREELERELIDLMYKLAEAIGNLNGRVKMQEVLTASHTRTISGQVAALAAMKNEVEALRAGREAVHS